MVPPITSLIWLLGIMRLTGMQVNVANMIAGVVVIGLASDYGIFMSFWNKTDEQTGTIFSITLCTLTTVIGAGALVFAKHPALWSVGVTVVVGVMTGFLTSILVVPKLGELWGEPVGMKTS
jgi:predicted exporter